jgi:hypothetical protein
LEREDIRLHDRENEMRGDGGERIGIGGGLKLYMKATSWHKNEGRGVILLYPFMITKADVWKP